MVPFSFVAKTNPNMLLKLSSVNFKMKQYDYKRETCTRRRGRRREMKKPKAKGYYLMSVKIIEVKSW